MVARVELLVFDQVWSMSVNKSVEAEAIAPARAEVFDLDTFVTENQIFKYGKQNCKQNGTNKPNLNQLQSVEHRMDSNSNLI